MPQPKPLISKVGKAISQPRSKGSLSELFKSAPPVQLPKRQSVKL
jgi:hypothetical protein